MLQPCDLFAESRLYAIKANNKHTDLRSADSQRPEVLLPRNADGLRAFARWRT